MPMSAAPANTIWPSASAAPMRRATCWSLGGAGGIAASAPSPMARTARRRSVHKECLGAEPPRGDRGALSPAARLNHCRRIIAGANWILSEPGGLCRPYVAAWVGRDPSGNHPGLEPHRRPVDAPRARRADPRPRHSSCPQPPSPRRKAARASTCRTRSCNCGRNGPVCAGRRFVARRPLQVAPPPRGGAPAHRKASRWANCSSASPALEEETRRLRGRLEESEFSDRTLSQTVEKLQGDVDYRLAIGRPGGRPPRRCARPAPRAAAPPPPATDCRPAAARPT